VRERTRRFLSRTDPLEVIGVSLAQGKGRADLEGAIGEGLLRREELDRDAVLGQVAQYQEPLQGGPPAAGNEYSHDAADATDPRRLGIRAGRSVGP
jgi:hypothetical protein